MPFVPQWNICLEKGLFRKVGEIISFREVDADVVPFAVE